MKNLILFTLLCSTIIVACNNRPVKKAGKIDVQLLVYTDPQNDPYNMFMLPLASIYFDKNNLLEVIPNNENTIPSNESYALIRNDKFLDFTDINSIAKVVPSKPLKNKNIGVRFLNDSIPFYDKRENLSDTVMNGYKYKRARIVSDSVYTVFYIHQTDTLLPYSLSKQFDTDYHGVLNRVDTYEKFHDRFTSLRLTVNDTIPQKFYNALKLIKQ